MHVTEDHLRVCKDVLQHFIEHIDEIKESRTTPLICDVIRLSDQFFLAMRNRQLPLSKIRQRDFVSQQETKDDTLIQTQPSKIDTEDSLEKVRRRRAERFASHARATASSMTIPTKQPQFVKCYICKTRMKERHDFYSEMCRTCGSFNFQKRMQHVPVQGAIAIVTGGRVKIGFEVALKLLRGGAHVVVTTRFVKDAFVRYANETDFASWRSRLQIEPLNLMAHNSVTAFVERFKKRYKRLDILINNAAQTLRRTTDFYSEELKLDTKSLPCSDVIPSLIECPDANKLTLDYVIGQHAMLPTLPADQSQSSSCVPSTISTIARQMCDEYGQAVDLSPMNTWISKAEDVPLSECIEVHVVNAIAPLLLTQQLLPLLKRSESEECSHVINVTAMEGSFSRKFKTEFHVHTNMAKASMNMITRTLGNAWKEQFNILMNSVDTGWVDNMFPHGSPTKTQVVLPIDVVDAAARILDPIVIYKTDKTAHNGCMFKDYFKEVW